MSYRERNCADNYNKSHNKFIFWTAISILLISNHNSFRVLFDKTASVYFIWEIYTSILALGMASPGNRHCASCIGTVSFPISQQCDLERATARRQSGYRARAVTTSPPLRRAGRDDVADCKRRRRLRRLETNARSHCTPVASSSHQPHCLTDPPPLWNAPDNQSRN